MTDDDPGVRADDAAVRSVVRAVLSALPGGCTWLVPVRDADGRLLDFVVGAASVEGDDIYGRGTARVDARLSQLYPSMVDGPLWTLYRRVVETGEPGHLAEFQYEEHRAGVVAESLFDVTAQPVLGGVLVWWHRVDEDRRRLALTELLGSLGWAEYDPVNGRSLWSPGTYRIFERDPALGPMSQAEQGAAVLPEDRGVAEVAWQTLDSGASSDVTVRVRAGGSVKHLRILSDVARDADGTPLKIYAVVQDVTAREDSRSAIDRLHQQLRRRELSALAEHRLAAQLQQMIQPVPREPLRLAGLEATVNYLPAESAVRVGGDWYHAQEVGDGRAVVAIGDVAGHGLAAASGMAHLRYGLVAWLSIGITDPGTLLAHLNSLCARLRLTGTAVVGVYDPASGTFRWARAGHLPPLLARAGRATALALPAGMLLGADPVATYPAVATRLSPGDLLLLYTDGLTERRTDPDGRRLAAVGDALSAASADPDGEPRAELRTLLSTPSPDDDTCTLVLRVLP
jgi:serine phosphatase RsbU (regulator of sigma subunit)